ncbi:hypothetical protein V1525DRAFT_381304 [Lipomyces kononenkoae]|uniref:Uncharacterized protein n=1 Tax=Lipomyces kononenkoae TaxID=34357 RepID=A0ACC3SV79_LIPKO
MVSTTSSDYSRACDNCHVRKVKCGHSHPCPRCRRLNLECSYNRFRKKKGPPGRRIALLRHNSSTVEEVFNDTDTLIEERINEECKSSPQLPDLSPNIINSSFDSIATVMAGHETLFQQDLLDSILSDYPASSESVPFNDEIRLSKLCLELVEVDSGTMDSLVRSYAKGMSKYYPLVDSTTLLARLRTHENAQNLAFGALVRSICAFVLVQPVFKHDIVLQNKTTLHQRLGLAQTLMDSALAMRNMNPLFAENPNTDSILTSFFLFASFFHLQLPQAAWLRLREAVTMAEILDVQSHYDETVPVEERQKRALLYTMLTVTEHAFAVQRRYTLTKNLLSRLQNFPALHQSHLHAAFGVTKLVSLFGVIKVDILECWNEKCGAHTGSCTKMTRERALDMHRLISEAYHDKTTDVDLLSEAQKADITISQQWLHNRLWNVCHSHGLLNATSVGHREMSFTYAIDIAQETMRISREFTMESLEVHGIGMLGKLNDIASTVVMLLSTYPSLVMARMEDCTLEPSDMEVLNQFIALLATFGGGQHPYLVPLMTAVSCLPQSS